MSKLITLLGGIFFLISFSQQAEALWAHLTEEQLNMAIDYGKKNKGTEYTEFFKEWRVDLGYGKGSARVITPFSQVAFEIKNSPTEYIKLTPDDINRLTQEVKDRLAIGVALYGDEIDFAKDCRAILKSKGQTFKPLEDRHSDTAETTRSWPQSPGYRAICYYYFDLRRLDPNATVSLEVTTDKGKPVEFTFDLSNMR